MGLEKKNKTVSAKAMQWVKPSLEESIKKKKRRAGLHSATEGILSERNGEQDKGENQEVEERA